MKEFTIAENSNNKEEIESALNGIRKTIEPYIYDKLHMIGSFDENIIVDSISCQSFSKSLCTEDKNGNRFFFPMNTLYGETKMKTDFFSSNYSCVIAKKLEEGHYNLYNALDKNNISPFGEIYVKSNSVLCVFEDYRKTEVTYRSRKNSNLEYTITVENDECLEKDEFEKLAKLNDVKKPISLHSYLNNYRSFRDINRYSCINISSSNENGIVGEIRIRYGLLDKYDICESEENFRLDMTVKDANTIVNTTDSNAREVSIEELPHSLQSIYQEGIQFIKKYGRKGVN